MFRACVSYVVGIRHCDVWFFILGCVLDSMQGRLIRFCSREVVISDHSARKSTVTLCINHDLRLSESVDVSSPSSILDVPRVHDGIFIPLFAVYINLHPPF